MAQLTLFHVEQAYASADKPLTNDALYKSVIKIAGIPEDKLNAKAEIGQSKAKHSPLKRKIRWYQQTLKTMNLLEKVEGERGVWQLTSPNKSGLHEPIAGAILVAYSTKLGLAVWAESKSFFTEFDEPIHLCVTSPPYPLRIQRNYGNVNESQWVDFITEVLEPVVSSLVDGGSIVLNISNDIFEPKSPSRSLYVERMVIALHDRLGLSLMDRWPWINLSKPPSPTQWACVNRVQLCSGWEPIFWFTNNPAQVRSDNRRVLMPHTEEHKKLIDTGGDKRVASYGDGAYRLNGSSFTAKTKGKIPKNVIHRGHRCSDTQEVRRIAKALGLPAHPAMFPTAIAEFAIQLLTQEDDLVVDPFAGSNKVGLAAERNNRRWVSCDNILEYVRVQAEVFKGFPGFSKSCFFE